MKIYDRAGFPNPSRIRIVVAEKGLEDRVDYVSVDLIGAEHKQAPFLAINPSGKIPVLELEDGTQISESTAITEYLDNLDGTPTLTGTTPREKAMIHMMQKRAEVELMDGVDGYFHYATPGLGDAMIPYTSPDWAGRKEWGERQRDKAVRAMHQFDGMLQTRPYLAGDRFSMADITAFAALNFAGAAGIAIPADCNALTEWRERVSALPSVRNRSGQSFLPEDLRRFGF
ncbi:glutathione S-transferase [Sphingomonas sp. AP4-R1]|uniref:glutathione S-transferase family protein n=1 Tax=Sphingomonas sp. AP4-R1 TaxID=2735134 RepID=UPI001493C7A2|nr:glutathione S-transferase [Sphingomonas sp. AP4-R1]QJU56735.1 glutathione S-transferase [Sphingomonas sp. AP4-R1]